MQHLGCAESDIGMLIQGFRQFLQPLWITLGVIVEQRNITP